MKKLWIVAALFAALTAPLYGAAFGLGTSLVGSSTEFYQRPAAGGVFLEAEAAGTRAISPDPGGKHVIPLGMSLCLNVPHAEAWLVRLDAGRTVREVITATTSGVLVWAAEDVRSYYERLRLEPGGMLPLVVVMRVIDARRRAESFRLLGFIPTGITAVSWSDENRPSTLAVSFDNWCGWKPGQPWREPAPRFWLDRLTWNRSSEVSDLVPTGQQAGTENWSAKWASQLGPGNSLLAKVRFEDGNGQGVDPRGQVGLFFLTKAERQVPFSLPGSLCELIRLPRDWHALPESLRVTIADLGLQPWLLVWTGDPRAATFVVPLALRQAVAASFPLQPGLRRLLIVGADGFEAMNGLALSFGTDDAGQDVRVLVPTGQGGAKLPKLWLDVRGFPAGELQEGVEPTPIAPAVKEDKEPLPKPAPDPERLD